MAFLENMNFKEAKQNTQSGTHFISTGNICIKLGNNLNFILFIFRSTKNIKSCLNRFLQDVIFLHEKNHLYIGRYSEIEMIE